ncbi:sunset domain-containing protein [Gordonia insulae]|uniref:Uncharacterized protein n=1 Tax=Gordonia insulae TaxID=2420509 RepID=A0A3G8JLI0_9ACTN|nr:hypothetical protein [Gordonia insulae]AZG45299.1 hypothetical protein D7316_01894 [Gordonia insulae]
MTTSKTQKMRAGGLALGFVVAVGAATPVVPHAVAAPLDIAQDGDTEGSDWWWLLIPFLLIIVGLLLIWLFRRARMPRPDTSADGVREVALPTEPTPDGTTPDEMTPDEPTQIDAAADAGITPDVGAVDAPAGGDALKTSTAGTSAAATAGAAAAGAAMQARQGSVSTADADAGASEAVPGELDPDVSAGETVAAGDAGEAEAESDAETDAAAGFPAVRPFDDSPTEVLDLSTLKAEVDAAVAAEPVHVGDGVGTYLKAGEAVPVPIGAHLALDDPHEPPDGYPIKASADAGLYYPPDVSSFAEVTPQIWFASTSAAEAAHFARAESD